jgi:hypothetical protein
MKHAAALLLATLLASNAAAQEPQSAPQPATAVSRDRAGIDLFGGAGVGFPAARDSFDALGLRTTAFDFGGGARVTNLWGNLFAQVSVSRWSDSGERAFVADDGTAFPLGIPLDVDATFVDGTVGVKTVFRRDDGRISYLSYVGLGAGVVRYEERSPFAEPGDDLKTTKPSYHGLLGVEVPIASALAIAVEGRYRYIPDLLGEQGASAVLEEKSFGGFQTAVWLRLGFGGPRYVVAPAAPTGPEAPPQPTMMPTPPPLRDVRPEGTFTAAAPIFALPDATRTPLRTMPAGTTFFVRDQKGDWVQIEFNDPQFGRRVGWVQRKFVRVN